jgi:hypothetical protein
VTISFGYILNCGCCNLHCGCFNLFCNVWVCVCVCFAMCVSFGNMYTCIYCVLYCLYCVFVLFRLCMFSYLFCLYYHRVTTQLQFNNNNNNNNTNVKPSGESVTSYVALLCVEVFKPSRIQHKTNLQEVTGMRTPKMSIEVTRTVSTRNYNRYSITSQSTTWQCCSETSVLH